jgi:hypothetical protein
MTDTGMPINIPKPNVFDTAIDNAIEARTTVISVFNSLGARPILSALESNDSIDTKPMQISTVLSISGKNPGPILSTVPIRYDKELVANIRPMIKNIDPRIIFLLLILIFINKKGPEGPLD